MSLKLVYYSCLEMLSVFGLCILLPFAKEPWLTAQCFLVSLTLDS